MRIFVSILALVLAPASWLWAQVSAEIVFEQEQFLRDESVPLKVRITNLSGQTLQLGKEADWLTFAVESRENRFVSKEGDPPVAGEFTLDSAFTASKRVDIAPYFSLDKVGRYHVTATVKIKQWDRQITTKPAGFNIITGAKLWERLVGVPTTNGVPEVRKYTLQQARVKDRPTIYARVTDENDVRVFKVLPLGPVVSFSKTEQQLDKFSNLHVLFRDGRQTFNYSVVNPDGELRIRRTHAFLGDSHPALREDDEGFVKVVGGQRLVSRDDVPSASVVLSTNEVKAIKP